MMRKETAFYLGVDLAGSEKQKTGICLLNERLEAKTWIVYPDKDLIRKIQEFQRKVKIIAIDAPLSLPRGRKNMDHRDSHHFRECDLELRRLGIKFFPITLGPMRQLTKRGIALKKMLEKKFQVIETYPGGSADLLGVPRSKNAKGLVRRLQRMGVKIEGKNLSRDELDAILCALAAKAFAEGTALILGDADEGEIVLTQFLPEFQDTPKTYSHQENPH